MENVTKSFFDKMNEEMSKPHSNFEDAVHNWLCTQEANDELVKAVFREGKSIKSACNYVIEQARKQAQGSVAAIEDAQVWQWVSDYFTGNQTEVKGSLQATVKAQKNQPVDAEVTKEVENPKKAEKKAKPKNDDLMSIFDFISVPDESDEEDGEDEESDND